MALVKHVRLEGSIGRLQPAISHQVIAKLGELRHKRWQALPNCTCRNSVRFGAYLFPVTLGRSHDKHLMPAALEGGLHLADVDVHPIPGQRPMMIENPQGGE